MVNGGYGMKNTHVNGGAPQELPTPSSDTTHETENEIEQEEPWGYDFRTILDLKKKTYQFTK